VPEPTWLGYGDVFRLRWSFQSSLVSWAWRNDLLAGEIFEDIICFGHALKFPLPTNEVGFSFEFAVVLDLVQLGVSHVCDR